MSERKNNLWLAVHYVITLAGSLLSLKFNLLNFGAELFGVWVLITSIWGLSNVVDLGFGMALIRYISRHSDDTDELNIVSSTGFLFYSVFGLLILGAALLIGKMYYLDNPNLVSQSIYTDTLYAHLLLAAFFYTNYISAFFRAVYEGLGYFIAYSKIAIIYSLSTLGAAVLSFLLGYDFTGLALFLLISAVIQLLILAFRLFYLRKGLKIVPGYFRYSKFRELFTFSISVQGATILGTATDPVLKYIIGNNLSVSYVGYYDIARRFAVASSGLFFAAFRTIYPKAGKLQSFTELRQFLMDECAPLSGKGVVFGGFVYAVCLPAFFLIFTYFYKSPQSFNLFILLSLTEVINLFGFSYYLTLMGFGKAKLLALIQLINLAAAAFFVWLGARMLGTYAGLAGYTVSIFAGNLIMVMYLRKNAELRFGEYFKTAAGNRLITVIVILLVFFTLSYTEILSPLSVANLSALAVLILLFRDFRYNFTAFKPLIAKLRGDK